MLTKRTSNNHSHSHHENQMMIWLIVDGVGLAMITACTLFDAMTAWRDNFKNYFNIDNPDIDSSHSSTYFLTDLKAALLFWFFGRFLQVIGLFYLISYAATFQNFAELERSGMLMLTVGPVLNIIACLLFDCIGLQPADEELKLLYGDFNYKPHWLSTEINELFGILILDISMIDMHEFKVVLAEVIGFTILGGAALFEYSYNEFQTYPVIIIRRDFAHISDAIGLFLLTLVGIAHYRSKVYIKNQLNSISNNVHLV